MKQKSCQKLKKKEPAKLLCFSRESSPLAQDFLGMTIRKRVSWPGVEVT
jgi:hypothetical protein